jgi:hypothetical protein
MTVEGDEGPLTLVFSDDPVAGDSNRALNLVESGRLLGSYRWIELRLFEVVGGWVASEVDPAARVLFDVQSRHHAWHAELWAERLPGVDALIDAESVAAPPGAETEELFASLGGHPDRGAGGGTGGTLVRLVGLSRVVLPRLVCGYLRHLRAAVSVSDDPVIRALRLALRDEIEEWQATELMVQSLLRRPHDVAVVTDHQQRLEALVAGSGPGLVVWPGELSD